VTVTLSLAGSERALSRSALNARQAWSTRVACIVNLQGDYSTGRGEAAPLPGFSPDTLQDCQAALAAFDATRLPAWLEPGQSVLGELSRASSRLPARLPAARAALEGALLELWSRAAGKPAWALLRDASASPPSPRAVAALLMGDADEALAQALRAQARGIATFKLKVGRPGQLERELALVRELRAELGAEAKLRLDANQSFSASEARDCLVRFAEQNLELVEEPCTLAELSLLTEIAVPLAFDESLLQLSPEVVEQQARGVYALVLKPTLLGGVSACYAWANAATRVGAQVILSHAFEGPLGLGLSAALALSIGSDTSAHGLDLEGARLEDLNLPFFSGSHVQPWSEAGFGVSAEPV
jgi:o-succinylbenzoate synthase